MTRRARRAAVAFLALFALLTSQLALSAHACEMLSSGGAAIHSQSPSPCPDMPVTSNLCEQHCQFGASAVDQGKPLPALDVTVVSPGLHVDRLFVLARTLRLSLRDSPLPPEPPPALRFSVLRI
jgi:hypothetical protein